MTVKEECDAKTGESHLTNYSYDANGNCTREGVSLGEDKKYIYTYYKYDCMNNLISVSVHQMMQKHLIRHINMI